MIESFHELLSVMLFQEHIIKYHLIFIYNIYQANQLPCGTLIRENIYKHMVSNYKRRTACPYLLKALPSVPEIWTLIGNGTKSGERDWLWQWAAWWIRLGSGYDSHQSAQWGRVNWLLQGWDQCGGVESTGCGKFTVH